MPIIFLGALLGLMSAIFCAIFGDITLLEAFAIYILTGILSVLLLLGLTVFDPDL